jgi:hypothetical protein
MVEVSFSRLEGYVHSYSSQVRDLEFRILDTFVQASIGNGCEVMLVGKDGI